LHGTANARSHRLRLGRRAQNRLPAIAQVDRDDEVDRRLQDALQLVRQVSLAPGGREARGLGLATAEKACADALAHLAVAHHDEPPRLREPHARRGVSGAENAIEHLAFDVHVGTEVANVATKSDALVNRAPRLFGKRFDGFRL